MRRRIKSKHVIAAVLAVCFILAVGCETTGQSAGLGAVLGGTAGAIIGNQSGHAWQGALIGAAVGGLAGYAVKKLKDRQTKNAQQTAQENSYTPDQGLKLAYKGGSVSPGTVKPGDKVVAKVEYAAMGTGANGVEVKEKRVLSQGDKTLGTMSDDKVRRTDGTWESSVEFQVPQNAAAGQYTVAQNVSTSNQSIEKAIAFDVKQASAMNSPDDQPRFVVSMVAK